MQYFLYLLMKKPKFNKSLQNVFYEIMKKTKFDQNVTIFVIS